VFHSLLYPFEKMRSLVVSCSFVAAAALELPSEILGYYSWNWGAGSTGPAGANIGCSFTGQVDVDQAIAQYTEGAAWCCPELLGDKFLTVGGGNSAGLFTEQTLKAVTAKAETIKAAGFAGIMYDVEEVIGPSSTMVPLFSESFAAMRKAGLIVAVTTSHSAPYQCDTPQDAVDIVKAWCADSNLDVISPQLYSSGSESAPELVPTNSCKDAGCTFDLYTTCKAEIAPSIVEPSHYPATKEFFSTTVSRATKGYFMWAQRKGDITV
jgi:hypothetical protein